MSSTATRSRDATTDVRVGKADMKLEVITIPVSDVERAKEFYGGLGWRLDADFSDGAERAVPEQLGSHPGEPERKQRSEGGVVDDLEHRPLVLEPVAGQLDPSPGLEALGVLVDPEVVPGLEIANEVHAAAKAAAAEVEEVVLGLEPPGADVVELEPT